MMVDNAEFIRRHKVYLALFGRDQVIYDDPYAAILKAVPNGGAIR